MVDVVLGSQWGDEGKGKLVDLLVNHYDIVARCAGGNNAGHTIVVNNIKYDFHMLPSGLVNLNCLNLLGNGVVIHLPSLFNELNTLEEKGLKDCSKRLRISSRAHLVFNFHQIVDKLRESDLKKNSKNNKNIGTTGKGIGPTYSTKASRSGLRIHHLINDDWEFFVNKYKRLLTTRKLRYGDFDYDYENELLQLKKYRDLIKPIVVDSTSFLNIAMKQNKKILVEGANALMLDIDFGTYPFVTSSNTCIGGVLTGLGLPPNKINDIFGVVKAYTTRVGEGPFPTEQLNDQGEKLQSIGQEVGVTTGRKRRCGWLDLVILKYSNMINGYTSLNITKLDVLDTFKEIPIAISYSLNGEKLDSFPADLSDLSKVDVEYITLPGWNEDITKIETFDKLPINAKKYLKYIEDFLDVPVEWVGTGPKRENMLKREIKK